MQRIQLHRQAALLRQSLFDQGYLDEQFTQLEELQDDAEPNFVEQVVSLYFQNSPRIISSLEQALAGKPPLDFEKLDDYMHQFQGSCSSIGAKRVRAECNRFRVFCKAGNGEGCRRAFLQLKNENATLKTKLEALIQLAKQAKNTG